MEQITFMSWVKTIQGINDTTIYAKNLFHNNFTEFGVKFVYIIMVIIVIYLLMVDKN